VPGVSRQEKQTKLGKKIKKRPMLPLPTLHRRWLLQNQHALSNGGIEPNAGLRKFLQESN